jgi:hypothetical protein
MYIKNIPLFAVFSRGNHYLFIVSLKKEIGRKTVDYPVPPAKT